MIRTKEYQALRQACKKGYRAKLIFIDVAAGEKYIGEVYEVYHDENGVCYHHDGTKMTFTIVLTNTPQKCFKL